MAHPARPYLVIGIEHDGQRSLLRLRGDLDACSRDQLRAALCAVLTRCTPRFLVIDLSALGFADCAGLSVIVWAHNRLAEQGHECAVTGARPAVRRLLSLTGLDTYLNLSLAEPAR